MDTENEEIQDEESEDEESEDEESEDEESGDDISSVATRREEEFNMEEVTFCHILDSL